VLAWLNTSNLTKRTLELLPRILSSTVSLTVYAKPSAVPSLLFNSPGTDTMCESSSHWLCYAQGNHLFPGRGYSTGRLAAFLLTLRQPIN
jgi:hypothetical protein